MSTDIAARGALAREMADEAGRLCLALYQSPELTADLKPDNSPVTRADREAEELIRRRIEAAFPDDAILGEEYGLREGRSGFTWVLDPIDGTRAFVRGIPTWGNLIAVVRDGRAVAGVANFPALGETVRAEAGGGAFWKPPGRPERPARVSAEADLSRATVESVSPATYLKADAWPAYERLVRAAQRLRGWNDAYAFALAATGRIDAAVDIGLKIWDVAPFDVIVREAGGTVSDFAGRHNLESPNVLVTNTRLHPALVRLLSS